MKKLVCILFFLFLGNFSNAQSSGGWIDSASIWNHTFWEFNWGNPFGYHQRYYDGDTLINGKNFQIVRGIRRTSVTYTQGVTTWGSIGNLLPNYFYTHNDSVYLLQQDSSLQFLWALNPSAGDIWEMGFAQVFFPDTIMQSFVRVDSVKVETLNGQLLKRTYLSPCINANGDDFDFQSTIVYPAWLVFSGGQNLEKIGPTKGWNFLGQFKNTGFADEQIADELFCFQSNVIPYYSINGSDSCFEKIFTVGLKSSNELNRNISLSPNPAEKFVRVNGLSNQNYFEVINMEGKLMANGLLPQDRVISIESLSNGIYYLKLLNKDSNGEIIVKKLVVFNK